ncbi:MAG: selenoneine synthase SenA [Burkholderiales bacterium]|nr:selenoneine synthase SenA [Burkholderiales bacterium]
MPMLPPNSPQNVPAFSSARQLSGPHLAAALCDSRRRLLALVDDLSDAQWQPAYQSGVNPVAWELAHIAWFAEFWILRGPYQRTADGYVQALQAPRYAGPDRLFDSARLAHAQRWQEPMPSRAELAHILAAQLAACIAAIPDTANMDARSADAALYFHRLALLHEDMHAEAFYWMRAALGYPAPGGCTPPLVAASQPLQLAAAQILLGSGHDAPGFAFDNEQAPHSVQLAAFEIDSAPLTAGAYADFVEQGGYSQADYWPAQAGVWRKQSGATHPQHWRKTKTGAWQTRWFDRWLPLAPQAAAIHLNAYEAQAYCLWAKRRLPSAAEWEYAASTRPDFLWGHSVWEWTSDAFLPYPGFVAGPYADYSQPWFKTHRELRGGAFATHARLHHPYYRNFFQPQRQDIFAGLRTVAL